MKFVILQAVTLTITFILLPNASSERYESVYVHWSSELGFQATRHPMEGGLVCATASIDRGLNVTGWHVLHISTNESCTNEQQAFSAGVGEAVLTYNDIYQHWFNTMHGMCDNRKALCQKVQNFLNKNYKWSYKMINKNRKTQPYWYQVELFLMQLRGLAASYQVVQKDEQKKLTFNDFLTSYDYDDDDDDDFESFLVRGAKLRGSRSCSGLIKLLPDSSDLYTSHDTWSSFESMWKVLKKYDFHFTILPTSNDTIPGNSISFSSYPGEIQSGDDFYITSASLVVQETTTGNNNKSLWAYVKPEGQIMEQIRTMIANRLATSGKEWSKIFSKYNSGTYNNQWMIVDYKLFKKGTPQNQLENNLLWILEQLPGYVKAADMTDELRVQTYWPSYNIPYFSEVFNLSGNNALVRKYGDWFTYDKNPRALMFKRDHVKVKDTISMIALMRYNNYKYDPLSRCECTPPYSGENAIAARNDVNPANGTYPFAALGHRSHTATDMKLATADLVNTLQMIAVSGPPYSDDLPPFRWSTSDFKDNSHLGQPDLWEFHPYLSIWPEDISENSIL
ncbi:hypothetical protein L9F63_012053 [Diploptera punctata]|uniref:Phospholipase B-like n=1 Tax=Diploptera punctata TaxID=6984 RepID=A0AAD8AD50_DIPPU|nr:hypothetical protein L9F63_012053 [Diploptera punctata]